LRTAAAWAKGVSTVRAKFIMETANTIIGKWQAREVFSQFGVFLRHLDGDFKNDDPSNLEGCHPFDAFSAMYNGVDWAIDWADGLTDEEQKFVRDHLWNFCVTFRPNGGASVDPDSEAAALVSQGDAALAAGEQEKALELYEAAKEVRAKAMFAGMSTGRGRLVDDVVADGRSSAGAAPYKPLGVPKHGRRSTPPIAAPRAKPMICTSTPSRRVHQEGKPTRKDEVAARVAARNGPP